MNYALAPVARWVVALAALASTAASAAASETTFGDDIAFLKQHVPIITLSDNGGTAQIAVVPAWQGRVMTSTVAGEAGQSFGWINRELIASGKVQPHINVFGGEDRLWLGPEGGQFGIFFSKGAKFDLDHWFVPAVLDTLPFQVIAQSRNSATFHAQAKLTNWSGTQFQVAIQREVRVLNRNEAWTLVGLPPSNKISIVAYESVNTLTNVGKEAWKESTGLLSLWVLGMFNPSPAATIVVPIRSGPDSDLGPKVGSDYFGVVPPGRLKSTDHAIFFSGDGRFRSKIGVSPKRSLGRLGSYDSDHRLLTIVIFDQPTGQAKYVNSQWKLQDAPYSGDAANSYNDGPPSPGVKPLGPFFELETSSPAAALAPGARATHIHRTLHLMGPEKDLDSVARRVLGISLEDMRSAFEIHGEVAR